MGGGGVKGRREGEAGGGGGLKGEGRGKRGLHWVQVV